MAITSMSLTIHVAWWVAPYIRSIALFCWLTGAEPDLTRVGRTIERGVTIREP